MEHRDCLSEGKKSWLVVHSRAKKLGCMTITLQMLSLASMSDRCENR